MRSHNRDCIMKHKSSVRFTLQHFMSLQTMSTSLALVFFQRLYVNVLQTPTQKGQLENMKLYFPEHKYTQEFPQYLPARDYLCHVAKAVYHVYFQNPRGGRKMLSQVKECYFCMLTQGRAARTVKQNALHSRY